jgi:hypothetical protein
LLLVINLIEKQGAIAKENPDLRAWRDDGKRLGLSRAKCRKRIEHNKVEEWR